MTITKLTGKELRKGMAIGGRTIVSVRHGAGSAKMWTYVRFTESDANGSYDGRYRKNTVRIEVEIAS